MVEETSLIRTNRSVSSSPPSDVHWCLVLASHCSRQMGPSSPSLFLCRHDHYYYSITHRTTASRALFSPSFFNGGGPTPRLILSIQQLQETISSSAETRHILHCCCVLSLCYGSGPHLICIESRHFAWRTALSSITPKCPDDAAARLASNKRAEHPNRPLPDCLV